MSLQYGELRPTNGWDRLASLGHPSTFQRVSRLGFVTPPTCRSTKLCTVFSHLLGWYTIYIYIFGASCSLTEFCQVQNSLCVQVLCSPILAALLHGTRGVRVSQTLLRRGTNNGRNFRSSSFSTEGDTYNLRAAITFGICKPLVIFNERYNID